jgi:two-component system chemotaxis sensor kinase CheA
VGIFSIIWTICMSIEQDDLLTDFLVESKENLDHLDEELLILEANPRDKEVLNAIFRRLHTIKGVCGFLDLVKLESVSHAGETLLSALRNGERDVDDTIITLLLTLVDAIRTILSEIETNHTEGSTDYKPLAEKLLAATHSDSRAISAESSLDDEFEAILAQNAQKAHNEQVAALPAVPAETANVHNTQSTKAQAQLQAAVPVEIAPHPDSSEQTSPTEAEHGSRVGAPESSLRVDVQLLDNLMNLAGELVLARNQILQATKSVHDATFRTITQRLNLVTSELQEGVMKTRMQPINTVWGKFPRVVRDLSRTCNKKVRLEMFGKETELDKTLIEAIKDPLTHIVRNSIDHGIESPEKRSAAGKDQEGCISLKAYHEGGYVIVEITDDGAGLNTEKIRSRAVEKGLVTRERAQNLSEAEVHRLIFAAGFSTADTVTNLSGRGVGMDVVKSSIEGIGGQVDISSRTGNGSTIRLKIPLTLAIIPALLLTCGRQRFAVPQSAITELVRLESSHKDGPLSWIGKLPFYRLRGELLPVLFLTEHLKIASGSQVATSGEKVIVVLDVDNHRFGVVVDAVHDTEEIVVKPLGQQLKCIPSYAGATILGDGQIALILDPVVLARQARVDKAHLAKHIGQADALMNGATTTLQGFGRDSDQLLIIQLTPDIRAALPLNKVSRLEEFKISDVEFVGTGSVIKYRGGILRLVHVPNKLGLKSQPWCSGHVVVIGNGDSAVGLQVDAILDVSHELSAVRPAEGERGITSYGVVQGKIIALLDIEYLTRTTASLQEHLEIQPQ